MHLENGNISSFSGRIPVLFRALGVCTGIHTDWQPTIIGLMAFINIIRIEQETSTLNPITGNRSEILGE